MFSYLLRRYSFLFYRGKIQQKYALIPKVIWKFGIVIPKIIYKFGIRPNLRQKRQGSEIGVLPIFIYTNLNVRIRS